MQSIRSDLSIKTIPLVIFAVVLAISAFLAPYVVAFILTRFENQQSTLLQRGWIIFWLVAGQIYGVPGMLIRPYLSFRRRVGSGSNLLLLGVCAVPGIGAWVFVAKMIMEGGICKIM